jgi:hypothetical protein
MTSLKTCARILALAALPAVLPSQIGLDAQREPEPRMPGGKSQKEEILKLDHQKNLADAARLVELTESLKADLEKYDRYVLPIPSLKKTEEIEKLAKAIRGRLTRY